MKYEYDAVLREDKESSGAYVAFPWDIRKEFGKGRVKVHAEPALDGAGCLVVAYLHNKCGDYLLASGRPAKVGSFVDCPPKALRRGCPWWSIEKTVPMRSRYLMNGSSTMIAAIR